MIEDCLIDSSEPYWCLRHKNRIEYCKEQREKDRLAQLPKSRNPHYLKLIEKIKSVHESKSHDYAKEDNVFSNFEYAGKLAEIFTNPVDKSFAVLIGVKLARLAELRSGKKAKNEPLLDTIEDMTNYSAIWGSMIMKELEEDGRKDT